MMIGSVLNLFAVLAGCLAGVAVTVRFPQWTRRTLLIVESALVISGILIVLLLPLPVPTTGLVSMNSNGNGLLLRYYHSTIVYTLQGDSTISNTYLVFFQPTRIIHYTATRRTYVSNVTVSGSVITPYTTRTLIQGTQTLYYLPVHKNDTITIASCTLLFVSRVTLLRSSPLGSGHWMAQFTLFYFASMFMIFLFLRSFLSFAGNEVTI